MCLMDLNIHLSLPSVHVVNDVGITHITTITSRYVDAIRPRPHGEGKPRAVDTGVALLLLSLH